MTSKQRPLVQNRAISTLSCGDTMRFRRRTNPNVYGASSVASRWRAAAVT
jgi:hypothetical protein